MNITKKSPPIGVVFDDDKEFRSNLGRYLRRHGFTVKQVSSPSRLTRALTENARAVQLVLIDLVDQRSGRFDLVGFDLASKARAAQPDAAIVILTGHQSSLGEGSDTDLRAIASEHGADLFINKGRLNLLRRPAEFAETLLSIASDKKTELQKIPTVQILPFVTPNLLNFLREDATRLCHLTPEQFEHFTAERLDRMGFEVTLTSATHHKDGGIDIIGAKKDQAFGDFLIAAQVKHHRGERKTGRQAVDRILSFKDSVFKFGLIVTNTTFTEDAMWRAAQADSRWFARLRDFEAIKRWLEEKFSGDRDYGELPDEIELAPGVRIKVPRPTVRSSRFYHVIVPKQGGDSSSS